MPRISLTDFVDVVSASGTPKATKVRTIKNRDAYDPAKDYWKRIRDQISKVHRKNLGKAAISRVLNGVSQHKADNYNSAVSGYKKWWGRKALKWFSPPDTVFSHLGIDVSVNPELGLRINGDPHLLKLYFKADPLTKNRSDIITHLMEVALQPMAPKDTIMSVLDVQKGKMFAPTVPIPHLSATLQAELAYVAALWPLV